MTSFVSLLTKYVTFQAKFYALLNFPSYGVFQEDFKPYLSMRYLSVR